MAAAREASIAVLIYVKMSDHAGNENFSAGIAEELLNLLSRNLERVGSAPEQRAAIEFEVALPGESRR